MSDFTADEIRVLKKLCSGLLGAQPSLPLPASAPAASRGASGGPSDGVMRFGKNKGVAFADANDRDLEWYSSALEHSLADESKARYRDGNEADLRAIRAEQAKRRGGGGARNAAKGGDFGDDPHAGNVDDIPFVAPYDPPTKLQRRARRMP